MPDEKIKITPAKGRPMLNWVGKRPLDYVKGFPPQLIEVFDPLNTGRKVDIPTYDELKDNWQNLLFHGDNKEVLATLLELGFRAKIDLIYIDPPFKSGADYVRKVELRGLKDLGRIDEDSASVLQQTMYFDIWNNDNYLQFMYERLLLLKELLSETGSIYVHLDWHVGHYVKLLMDEVFGEGSCQREIIWDLGNPSGYKSLAENWIRGHDTILFYTKGNNFTFNKLYIPYSKEDLEKYPEKENRKGLSITDVWKDIDPAQKWGKGKIEHTGFDTEKPEALLERIIKASSNPCDLVLDCFIGSGTTARVAQKLGRRWIGCDINKGAVYLTSRELQKIILEQINNNETKYPSFAIYKVNNYDLKLLQTEAIELAVQHIGIQRIRTDRFFDGTLGKNLVKIIDFNHPLTLLDLQLIQDELKKRPNEDRDITIVCLGKELAVDPWIDEWNKKHPVNKISIIELKTDKKYGSFLIHKPAEAKVKIERKSNKAFIKIEDFISPTIIERLNIDSKLYKVKITDFRSMIDCILIDSNYDGNTFRVVFSDVPKKKSDLIEGEYEIEISKEKIKIAVKIIDMLGEEVLIVKEI
jgi:DNA modification methylase